MDSYDLSILIPSRNEMFLTKTVENILENKRGKTEILIALDGQWAEPQIPNHPDITIVYFPESIGQRAATNQLARLSKAKYVMKLDAHCALDEGFDVKLMADMQDDWTVLPAMYNLHAFDWVCAKCGSRQYQGPSAKYKVCPDCGAEREREVIWKPREHRLSYFYRFDKDMHFQYWGAFKKRPEGEPDIAPSLSAQGSCFMLTREKYWELGICDEGHGSWGGQGTEVACKTWLSGGQLMVNKKTWYAHMFRTQGGDFGFPYPLSGSDVEKAREYSKNLWLNNTWPKAIHDLNWLLEKFAPVPDWHDGVEDTSARERDEFETNDQRPEKKLRKGVIYYTDNELDPKLMELCQQQILKGIKEKHIVSVSLKPLSFGKNIVLPLKRGYLTMAKQILAGLESSDADIVYFCEHDVLYHKSHFTFVPPEKDKYYYNTNVWRVRAEDGHALYTDNLQQLSGLVAYRETLIKHYRERVRILEEAEKVFYVDGKDDNVEVQKAIDVGEGTVSFGTFNQFVRSQGFEPGSHNRIARVDDLKAESFQSEYPNLDIRHEGNLTPSRWKKEQFRNQRYTQGWKEARITDIPGWRLNNYKTS